MAGVGAYGLDDRDVLEVATQLAPELFAALAIAEKLEDKRFPLESVKHLEEVLAATAGDGETFESPGVRISRRDPTDRFPKGFLPVTGRLDLIRKVYMAIVIAHESESRERLRDARAKGSVQASHPIDLEVL